jgi:hypothetical protein
LFLLPEADNPAEDMRMPETNAVDRRTLSPDQIGKLIDADQGSARLVSDEYWRFLCHRTSQTFGLQWKSYGGDKLVIQSTAYEWWLNSEKVKTEASRNVVAIPTAFSRSSSGGAGNALTFLQRRSCFRQAFTSKPPARCCFSLTGTGKVAVRDHQLTCFVERIGSSDAIV